MKKTILGVLFLATATLASCGPATSVEESLPTDSEGNVVFENVAITYGNPITGSDGIAMRELVRRFNQEYEGQINVTESFISETEYYESLLMTIPMKRSYDIALVHSYKVSSFANKNLLHPIQSIIDDANIDLKAEDYISSVYDAMYYQDALYGIPLDIHTIILYYNKTLLNQYELEVPTNRAELIAAAKMMPNTSSGGYGLPLSTTWPSEYIYTTALYQNGGSEIDEEGNPNYANAVGAEALKMVTDIVHTHHISPENVSVDSDLMLFNQGKAMFHINGDWMINSVVENGVDFGVTSLSKMFTDDADGATADSVAARSHCFVLPEGRNVAIKQQAAMVFAKYVTEHAYLWAEGGGHVPASNVARATEEYLALPYHHDYGDVDDFVLSPSSPYYYEAFSPVFSRVTTALSDSGYDAMSLLTAAEAEGNQLVEEAKAS
ncbi:ABC transporter substrate-binding protein [Trichlorobacter sp.]|jgi:multiple sugar transport system substrate-binding protein|uniref:ABC transporter substrate-binding protein n=1 Tax=Trichlorobacter sp. TaxID=2911007 RepID=UPI002A35F524|nr:extracellular solute-binding protein [Trichlorobacter sp.]MDY0385428.1 extracellular solute-binding protein [Trichlorobacter sp.]